MKESKDIGWEFEMCFYTNVIKKTETKNLLICCIITSLNGRFPINPLRFYNQSQDHPPTFILEEYNNSNGWLIIIFCDIETSHNCYTKL